MTPVTLVRFPARCPACGVPLRLVRKLSGAWWYECATHGALGQRAAPPLASKWALPDE